jgi:NADPH:quinone reductase-like Zn-dependent oxidoreductase
MADAMDLQVKRSAFAEARLVPAAPITLDDGEAALQVDAFSLTANNVTYAAMGDFLKYWQFYPAPEGWGRVPVWGFATVTESRSPNVKAGERVYGYLPMSTAFKVKPGARRPGGFSDESTHRAGLAPIYNSYTPNAEDPLYTGDTEALQMLFRPLFMTSFLIDDFIADNKEFGAKQTIFSSASAKTSYATAQLLKARGVKVIGLTSASNVAFTEKLGFYDQVLPYDAITKLDGSVPTVFVDIAGSTPVRIAVHEQFGDNLTYSCAVGATHWDAPRPDTKLPGPAPQMFFAPGVAQKRIKELGPAEFQRRAAEAWQAFLPTAARTTNIVQGDGLKAALRVFSDLAAGRASPADGHIIRLTAG